MLNVTFKHPEYHHLFQFAEAWSLPPSLDKQTLRTKMFSIKNYEYKIQISNIFIYEKSLNKHADLVEVFTYTLQMIFQKFDLPLVTYTLFLCKEVLRILGQSESEAEI